MAAESEKTSQVWVGRLQIQLEIQIQIEIQKNKTNTNTGLGREAPRSSSRRQRSRCPPNSSADSQVLSSISFCLPLSVRLINCALVAEWPILGVNYLQEPIRRHQVARSTIHHYLHSRHLLIIRSSNFFPEFLLQSHQLCAFFSI